MPNQRVVYLMERQIVVDEITGEPIATEKDPCPNCGATTCRCEQCPVCSEWRYKWVTKCESEFCNPKDEDNEE
jgi:hypothetical protein